jgi:hypothetical protein
MAGALFGLVLLAACEPRALSPPASAPPGSTAAEAQGTRLPGWVGSWSSPRCGERSYERWLELAPDGTFRADDRVSPCPPTVTCVWSGIVRRQGSYRATEDGRQLALQTETAAAAPKLLPLPTTLHWDDAAEAPLELAGVERCPYVRR